MPTVSHKATIIQKESPIMQPENPYAAPRTDVSFQGNVAFVKPTLKQLLFSPEGRLPRRFYWLTGLAFLLPLALAAGLAAINETLGYVAIGIVYIAAVWVGIIVGIKRWHDRGKSGWWIFIAFIPIVGGIWTLIECGFLRGTVGPNPYGADPTDEKLL